MFNNCRASGCNKQEGAVLIFGKKKRSNS
uniref:Uncharacterized protein n=1 Tax=Anguilla anguilla TaxID=7936 RepID=A0A0E9TV55_ANGAN